MRVGTVMMVVAAGFTQTAVLGEDTARPKQVKEPAVRRVLPVSPESETFKNPAARALSRCWPLNDAHAWTIERLPEGKSRGRLYLEVRNTKRKTTFSGDDWKKPGAAEDTVKKGYVDLDLKQTEGTTVLVQFIDLAEVGLADVDDRKRWRMRIQFHEDLRDTSEQRTFASGQSVVHVFNVDFLGPWYVPESQQWRNNELHLLSRLIDDQEGYDRYLSLVLVWDPEEDGTTAN